MTRAGTIPLSEIEWVKIYFNSKRLRSTTTNLKKRLSNLLTVKSIVTVALTAVFSVLALRGTISGTEFLTIFTVVIGFYFGTQRAKEDTK